MTLWAGADLLIFLSYMAIPIALLTVLRRRGDVPYSGLVVLFASFILLCGLTHLAGIVTLWWPIYPWIGALKLLTGIVSAITAIVLFRLIPTLVALPSPAKLQAANEELWGEMAAHETTLASLEAQVAERTGELQRLNTTLAVQAREAVHRSGNLLSVVASLANQSAKHAESKDEYVETLVGRIQALAKATSTVQRSDDGPSQDLDTIAREELQPLLEPYPDQVEIGGERLAVGPEAAQQISLALHELGTNSQKYSLPTSDEARISLNWRVTPNEDGEEVFELHWVEQLSPEAAQRFDGSEHEGFGTKLLTRIVPAVLRGTARREFEGREFRYCLSAPLCAVQPEAEKNSGDGLAARLVDESFGEDRAVVTP